MKPASLAGSTPVKVTPESMDRAQGKKPRDPRLDFFRGIAMFIILIAHTSFNSWTLWIPARFGFSDATETFVFCSGMASAIAFAGVFDRSGFFLGVARVAHRVWQVYWAHICLFLAVCLWVSLIDVIGDHGDTLKTRLNLMNFFERDTPQQLIGLMTLTYVPNYFDILPMYLVILCMIPIVLGLARISPHLALAFCATLWLATNVEQFINWYWGTSYEYLRFPAEPWNHEGWATWYHGGTIPPEAQGNFVSREWFFNPFAWQLIFFTGFAFMRGWIPAPPVNRWLIALAIAVVLVSLPWAYFRIFAGELWLGELSPLGVPWDETAFNLWLEEHKFFAGVDGEGGYTLLEMRQNILFLIWKTNFGLFRYLHFLATAYLAWVAVGAGGKYLISSGLWGQFVKIVSTVGQQSLAIFLFSMLFAQVIGYTFYPPVGHPFHITAPADLWTWRELHTAVVNIGGMITLVLVAYLCKWFKSQPWRVKTKPA
ncbi:MAG: OpgC domain-containing protein [Pseudomonadota bacterium]